jgi:uridine phosphorylase
MSKSLKYKGATIPIKEHLDFNEIIDIGVILEQNWMVYELARKFQNGRMIYCFSIDRDMYVLNKNDKSFVFLQAQGSPHTACYVEELRKRNAKKIYRIGTCGALQTDINIGDIILSAAAIRDEGTTDQYIPKYFPSIADLKATFQVYKQLVSRNLPTHIGITWTTDGRFVESDEKILSFSKLNVKNVDMETSALLLVCWLYKIPAVSIGIVTDKPIDDIREEFKGKIPDLRENKKMLSRLLYDITSSIIDLEKLRNQYGNTQ